jgi:hypothetical protein
MPRFSIRHLLTATALVALGCLALLKSSALLAAAMMASIALSLVAAIILAIYRTGDARAFWLGFSVVGWIYLLLCYGPLFPENNSPFGSTRSATGQLATLLYDRIHSSAAAQLTIESATTFVTLTTSNPLPPNALPTPPTPGWPVTLQVATGRDRVDFLNVAHALWALLIAFSGGWFAVWARRTRKLHG